MHLNGGAASGECVVGVGWGVPLCEGKRVHLYGGAAAMRDGVMSLQWGKCIVQELFVALSFSFAFALSCSFSKTFDGSFLGALVGAFLGAFLGTFGGEFSFAFVFARDVEWRAIGKLSFTFILVSTFFAPCC